jgi:hypothetical protein
LTGQHAEQFGFDICRRRQCVFQSDHAGTSML